MTEKGVQCEGITVKGAQCKLMVPNNVKFCRYHSNQSKKPKETIPRYDKGFIYVYTLTHLLEKTPPQVQWLDVKTNDGRKWSPKDKILIKIGLTQGKVSKRIDQWKNKCRHDITVIDPYSKHHLKDNSSIASLLSNLRLGSSKTKYTHYNIPGQGFYCEKNLGRIERIIHEHCWNKYNRGEVTCHGCGGENGPGTHKEWFLIDRKGLKRVFMMIDAVIEASI